MLCSAPRHKITLNASQVVCPELTAIRTVAPTSPLSGQEGRGGIPIHWASRLKSVGVKRPKRETDKSLPFRAQVKWSYTSTSPHTSTACKGAALLLTRNVGQKKATN